MAAKKKKQEPLRTCADCANFHQGKYEQQITCFRGCRITGNCLACFQFQERTSDERAKHEMVDALFQLEKSFFKARMAIQIHNRYDEYFELIKELDQYAAEECSENTNGE